MDDAPETGRHDLFEAGDGRAEIARSERRGVAERDGRPDSRAHVDWKDEVLPQVWDA